MSERASGAIGHTPASARPAPDRPAFRIRAGHVRTPSVPSHLVHAFPSFGEPITALASTPATDVVAVGLLSGTVVLYNLRLAAHVLTVRQTGRVTSIAFRTGTCARPGPLRQDGRDHPSQAVAPLAPPRRAGRASPQTST